MDIFKQLFVEDNTPEENLTFSDCIQCAKGALHMKEYDNGIYHCNLALKMNSENPEPYLHRGYLNLKKGNKTNAIEDWTKAVQLSQAKSFWREIGQQARQMLQQYS